MPKYYRRQLSLILYVVRVHHPVAYDITKLKSCKDENKSTDYNKMILCTI